MADRKPTHGPWQGLDFDPTTDLNRAAALCPDGWAELYWHAYTDPDANPGELSALRVFGVQLDQADDVQDAIDGANIGPIDFGLEEWPEGRLFIGKLFWDSGDSSVGLRPGYDVELLCDADGQPAHADPLPLVTCPKCQREVTRVTACRECKTELCDDCGDEHLVPDCPPQYESYCRALAAMSGEG